MYSGIHTRSQDHNRQEFTHFFLRLAPSLQACGERRTWFPPIRSHACMLYVIDNEQTRTIRSFAPGGARAGFQYVNEVSGSIEPYRAMPLLAISNTLNTNVLATSATKFWVNSCIIGPVNEN